MISTALPIIVSSEKREKILDDFGHDASGLQTSLNSVSRSLGLELKKKLQDLTKKPELLDTSKTYISEEYGKLIEAYSFFANKLRLMAHSLFKEVFDNNANPSLR